MGKPKNNSTSKKNTEHIWHEKGEREIKEGKSWKITLKHPHTGKDIKITCRPSVLHHLSPFSGENLDIQLLPVKSLIRHEGFLTQGLKKVSFMKDGISGWNDAPMVGAKDESGNIIIIDGSTRLTRAEVLTQLLEETKDLSPNPPVFPVQIIDFDHPDLRLNIWKDHHPAQDKLSKEEVLHMALNNQLVKAKQTRFGVRTDNNHIFSFAETQVVIEIPIKNILGFDPPDNHLWSWMLA